MAQVISTTNVSSTSQIDFNAGNNFVILEFEFVPSAASATLIINHSKSRNYFRMAQCYRVRNNMNNPVIPPQPITNITISPSNSGGNNPDYTSQIVINSLSGGHYYKLIIVLLNDE